MQCTEFIQVREILENLKKGSFFGEVGEKVEGNLKNGKRQGKSGKILFFPELLQSRAFEEFEKCFLFSIIIHKT